MFVTGRFVYEGMLIRAFECLVWRFLCIFLEGIEYGGYGEGCIGVGVKLRLIVNKDSVYFFCFEMGILLFLKRWY